MTGSSRRGGRLRSIALAAGIAAAAFGLNLGGSTAGETLAAGVGNCQLYTCYTITFNPGGGGSGVIKSILLGIPDGRIDCAMTTGVLSGKCSWTFVDYTSVGSVSVSFVATAATGSEVCYHACGPTLNGSELITRDESVQWFVFDLLPYRVTASKTGAGTGAVTSDPAGIDCGAGCSVTSHSFLYGTSLRLVATPDAGAVFNAWTGACAGQPATCTIVIGGTTSTNAVFGLPVPSPTPTQRPTPKPTTKPTTPPTSSSKPPTGPGAPSPHASGPPASTPTGAPASPTATDGSAETDASPNAQGSAAPPSGVEPAGQSGQAEAIGPTDLTLIVLAILGAGLLIAVGIGFGAAMLRPRRGKPG